LLQLWNGLCVNTAPVKNPADQFYHCASEFLENNCNEAVQSL
jgi:hypothetical protein